MDNQIFRNLDSNGSLKSQDEAVHKFAAMEDLDPTALLQPAGKEYWENDAKVLRLIGFPRVIPALPGMFVWLQDLNWPGALIVMEMLKKIPKQAVLDPLQSALEEAIRTDDEIWLENLSGFMKAYQLQETDFTSKEIYQALVMALISEAGYLNE